ncbi:alpha-(1-_3)-arabinofuranosyltransferase domain-containing protein [Corynebacterium pacaense]|uniref:alpha-(1->3)-arabinofuranosyltransferase domain-containing protein n=1 Tax=Corynebacterium pacaense TaxID=1816684 RepID=UPI0009B9FF5A|nr:alpha-(1->3)-arabinofuranosyltransferase family protein [Corynebacterium pacaense]
MVPARLRSSTACTHLGAWLLLAVLSFLQPPGQVAADTKLDLVLNPAGFLSGGLHAWTDTFTLGQLQNQAYGYLFPQGLFFLLAEPLPDWIAQRLWWWLVLGTGFSGFHLLVSRLGIGNAATRVIAAALFTLSPRTLTTLTAISSEAWPIMLAPWVCLPLLSTRIDARALSLSLLPAAAMGAVNATATLAALLPAAIILAYRRALIHGLAWGAGILAVNAWWIGPLIILGRYAPPFTEFIESAAVTTHWLTPVEILRGATSWTPFVDTERRAGYLLVNEPLFVMLTVLVAAGGLTGLALMRRRGLWVLMLSIGLLILGAAHLEVVRSFLDGPGAPLRNLHKFDVLVRMPLMVGVAALGGVLEPPRSSLLTRRQAGFVLVALVAVGATAPAWSARLLPRGTWTAVPDYWYQATAFLNEHASGTRTLILPGAPSARQTWGWTRDEPAQPLLDVPWAVRDAIPLVPPEAIRGLDGLDASLSNEALRRIGVGAVIVRHDLEVQPELPSISGLGGAERHTFGEVDVYLLDTGRNMWLSGTDLPTVAGGGEILSLLDTLDGYSPRTLVDRGADIVTDTPQLVGTNYGDGRSSAALASAEETEVRNRIIDYPSAGPLTSVVTEGSISASSSASDATSFGGSDPSRSLNEVVDGRGDTAWYPTPGDLTPWLEVSGSGGSMQLTPTEDVRVTVRSGDSVSVRDLTAGKPTAFPVPGGSARIELDRYAGITEVSMEGLSRTITVPDTSPDVSRFLFQRLTVPTGYLDRAFTAPRPMTVDVTASSCADLELDGRKIDCGPLDLESGRHMLRSDAEWVSLDAGTPSTAALPAGTTIDATDEDRLLLTTRAFNPGTVALIDGHDLTPVEVDAAAQGFMIPAGVGGEVEFSFAGERPYRMGLFTGAGLAAMVVLGCMIMAVRCREKNPGAWSDPGNAPWAAVLLIPVFGWLFLPAAAVAWAVPRFTLIPRWMVSFVLLAVAGLWLAQAPWPNPAYPGDSAALALLAAVSVLAVPMGFARERKH